MKVDYGWLTECRAGRLLLAGIPFFVVKASEPYAPQVVALIKQHEGDNWTEEDEQWAKNALASSRQEENKEYYFFVSYSWANSTTGGAGLGETVIRSKDAEFAITDARKRITENFNNTSVTIMWWKEISKVQYDEYGGVFHTEEYWQDLK